MPEILHLGLDLGAPHTPLWSVGGCQRPAWPCLQTSSEQDSQTSATEHLATRPLVLAGIPAMKEPVGLTRRDGKLPDWTTQIPGRSGKLLVWDVTVVSTLADSYVVTAACGRKSRPNSLLPENAKNMQTSISIHFPSNCHGDFGLNK